MEWLVAGVRANGRGFGLKDLSRWGFLSQVAALASHGHNTMMPQRNCCLAPGDALNSYLE